MTDPSRVAAGPAAAFLRRQGLEVVRCKGRYRVGEIDLIAREDEVTVVFGVSAREAGRYGSASEHGPRERGKFQHGAARRPRRVDWIRSAFHAD